MKTSDNKNKRLTTGMTVLYLLLTIGVGVAIIGNLVSIQWVHGDEWRERAAKREADVRSDKARRGNIYSSDGKVLATTVTECDLYLDLYDTIALDDKGRPRLDKKGEPMETGPIVDSALERYLDSACFMLHQAFPSRSAEYYRERIMTERQKSRPGRCFLVQRGVPYSVWKNICGLPGWSRGVVRSVDHRSVEHQVRAHIYGNMAGNVIGFRNDLVSGTYTGLEGYYDSILRGQDGLYNYHRLTMGMWLADDPSMKGHVERRTDDETVDTIMLRHRIDGSSIVSTIDTRYQDIAENSLRRALHQYGGTSGCAILMEVKTGYVLACVNLGIDTSAHEFMELRDRNVAVSDVYQPGSTFKTVALTAMLCDTAISIDTARQFRVGSKNYNGGRKDGQVDDDHRVKGPDGKVRDSLNVREIIEQSSNVGMAEMGWEYYRMQARSKALREGMLRVFPYDKLNPDLVAPQSRSYILEDMSPVSNFTRLCYGYSTRVTPLQLITFYNAIAAGGRMVKPQFCRAVVDDKGHETEIKPVVLNQHAFSTKTARMLRSLLEGVVNNGGTGAKLKSDTYLLAGKTGTAVKTRGYDASFAGFFPADNPQYTCIALLENCYAYGWQAGMVVKDIADCVVAIDKNLKEIVDRPKLKQDSAAALTRPRLDRGNRQEMAQLYRRLKLPFAVSDSAGTWVCYREASDSTAAQYVPFAPVEGQVPNCIGMTAKDAVALLHEAGYRVKLHGYGKVSSQSPRGGQSAKRGATIEITLK